MKLLVINGIPEGDQYAQYEQDFEQTIHSNTEHEIVYYKLRDMNINYCTGCWDCWMKTPGLCAIKDDQEDIIKYMPHVDHMIFMSPIIIGYESALLKKFKDRTIPIIHPYIRMHKGEHHHVQRYESTPDLSFIGITDKNTIQEDIDLMRRTYDRVSLNFDSTLIHFHTSSDIGGVANVFSNI